jgi:hypothetical protein
MWAKALRAFQVGNARRSHDGPAYGHHIYRRLAEIMAEYDPDNTFHHNKNIRPD